MGNELILIQEIKRMQDVFCNASHLYLACMDKDGCEIADLYGSDGEREFLQKFVNRSMQTEFALGMRNNRIENMVEHDCGCDYIRCCTMSVYVEEELCVVWVAIGVLADRLPENEKLPDGMLVTTEEQFYHHT